MKQPYIKPELSYPVNLDAANHKNPVLEFAVEANEIERAALVKRFDLASLTSLKANVFIEAKQNGIWFDVSGHITATLQQFCTVTGEPCDAEIDEDFFTEYKSADAVGSEEDDAELLESNILDIGEVVAQYFFLALPPFPRKVQSGDDHEQAETHRPFTVLQGLKVVKD